MRTIKQKANTQKNTLLKNAQANAESNFFKRVFFSPTQKKKIANASLKKEIYFSPTHGQTANSTDTASNVNRFVDSVCGLETVVLRGESKAAANIRYASTFSCV